MSKQCKGTPTRAPQTPTAATDLKARFPEKRVNRVHEEWSLLIHDGQGHPGVPVARGDVCGQGHCRLPWPLLTFYSGQALRVGTGLTRLVAGTVTAPGPRVWHTD